MLTEPWVSAGVLAALVLTAGTLAWSGWFGVVALAGLSIWWSQANKAAEGPALWTVGPGHTIVVTDAAGFAGLLVAGLRGLWLLWRWSRR